MLLTLLLVTLLLASARAEPSFLPTAYDAAGVTIEGDQMSVTLTSGVLRAFTTDSGVAGLAFEGAGAVSLTFADRGDAAAFANRQSLWFGAEEASVAPTLRGEPWGTEAAQGLLMGSPAQLAAITDGLPAVTPAEGWEPWKRLDVLERSLSFSADADHEWLVADFLTGDRYGFVRPGIAGGDEDRWLTLRRAEGSRQADDQVLALGLFERGVPIVTPMLSRPWVEAGVALTANVGGVSPTSLNARVRAELAKGRSDVGVDIEATFTMTVVDETLTHLRMGARRKESRRSSWSVTGLSINGEAVEIPANIHRGARVALPKPAARGDVLTVRFEVTDTWSVAGQTLGGGMATRLILGLPWVGSGGARWPFELTTGVPVDSGLSIAQSGVTTRTWEEDGVRWYSSETDGRPPSGLWIGVGEWVDRFEPPVEGLPAVALHLFPEDERYLTEFPPFMRTVMAYYQSLLPGFPVGELEVFQSPAHMGSFTWQAVPGLVSLQEMQTYGGEAYIRANKPHLEQGVMAHEVAHQYWGGHVVPARSQDRWISETFAEVYACLFVGAAFGAEACAVRQESWQESWESSTETRRVGALSHATASQHWRDIAYDYGPFIFGRTLMERIGANAFLGGLDRFVATHGTERGSTEALQAAFEATSGEDLSGFFDYWVQGGFIPSLSLRWDSDGGTIESDIPFGTLEVPVKLLYPDRAELLWVEVVDGAGDFELSEKPKKVLLDPDHVLLARKRKVSKR